jgi:hypothetical protein
MQTWGYALYWLNVNSEIELPEAAPLGAWDAGPTVLVRLGTMPSVLRNGKPRSSWISLLPDQCIFDIPGVASYCIEDGEKITVSPVANADPSEVRTFLLGAAFASLLHQKGYLVLHVSAIETPQGTVAFTGPSGAGKSTMVAKLHVKYGWKIVADDAAVVRFVNGIPMIYSGIRRLRLWRDAIQRLKLDLSGAERDRLFEDKFQLRLREHFTSLPTRLHRLEYLQADHQLVSQENLTGAGKVRALLEAIHRKELLLKTQKRMIHNQIILTASSLK